jgi:hypothetical protein
MENNDLFVIINNLLDVGLNVLLVIYISVPAYLIMYSEND